MAQKKKKQVTIEWSLTNSRQLEFLRACGLSYHFDKLPGATKPVARMILFGGSAGGGKLLSNDGQILTPFGWKLGKDLSVGDLVSNPGGSVQRIIQIKPEAHLPLWRVHFSDGTSTDVAKDHLWYAWRGRRGRKIRNKRTFGEPSGEIIETRELQEWIDRGYNPQIPICKEQPFNVTTKEKNKINPYLIGLLLGDGCLTQSNVEITCAHEDREYYHQIFPEYTSVISPKTLRFVGDLNRELKAKLALYGLLGKKSHSKFIPKQYKYSSVADRYALIQGLMDTDGYNDTKDNGCYYTTISKQLAEDVCFVLRSLGAMVTISVKQGRYKKDGEVFECSTVYELYIKHSDKRKLFSLPRKKIGKKIEISKRVTKVEVDGDIKGRCITVSNPNGLYITNDFIVTHNSDAILIAALMGAVAFPKCNIAVFRRSYPNLSGPGGIIMRSQELFPGLGKYHGGDKRWTLFNKSIIEFSHCATDADVYNYKSQQFDFLFIDESTEMTSFQIRYLLTRNRATVAGVTPFCGLATNPGGLSHGFHKKFFVDAGPPGVPIDVEIEPSRYQKHVFIPSRLSDNKILEDRDPGYRLTLENQPEEIRRALLDGDWDVFAGQYFKNFRRDKHVIKPFDIPSHWRKFMSVDWGYAAPCAVLWHAIEPSSGRVYTYREVYVTEHRAAEVAELIKDLSHREEIEYIKMSPDAWHERGLGSKASPGEVIAEEFLKLGLNVEPADNRRIIGWQRMREYLADAPDEKPWWQIFDTCSNLIRTIPEMVHDARKIEDINGDCEDHAVESCRYGLMSRPSPVDGASFLPGAREFYSGDEDEDDDLDDGVPEVPNWYGI